MLSENHFLDSLMSCFCRIPPEADIVFVHGLMGGAFHTWRQQDPDVKRKKDAPKAAEGHWTSIKTKSLINRKNKSEKSNDCAAASKDGGLVTAATKSVIEDKQLTSDGNAGQDANGTCTKCNEDKTNSGREENLEAAKRVQRDSVRLEDSMESKDSSASSSSGKRHVCEKETQEGYTDCWPKVSKANRL